MPHVVTNRCIDCKHTVCVTVCPVDCFHEGANILWIDPEECIDCAACVPECPEEAIFEVEDLPAEYNSAIEENAEKCKTLPVIVDTCDPLMARSDCKNS